VIFKPDSHNRPNITRIEKLVRRHIGALIPAAGRPNTEKKFNIRLTTNLPKNLYVNFFDRLSFDSIMVMTPLFGPPCISLLVLKTMI